MKLLTLNTHSLQAEDNEACLRELALAIRQEQIDFAALQEVNQLLDAAPVSKSRLHESGYIPCPGTNIIREGNFALLAAELLASEGYPIHWTWIYTHRGYHVFDEGLSILSPAPLLDVQSADISAPEQEGIKLLRRKLLCVQTQGTWHPFWICTTHTGWWGDAADPFLRQWQRASLFLSQLNGSKWLLGDMNAPANRRGESYDLMGLEGWQDCHARAEQKDDGITVGEAIDGWRKPNVKPMRIDLILAAQPGRTLSSQIIFNDRFYRRISDHFGVLAEEEVIG